MKQNKIGKQSLWAFGQTLGSRTAQLLWHDIHPVFSLSQKKKKIFWELHGKHQKPHKKWK